MLLFESDEPTDYTDSLSEELFLQITKDSDFGLLEKDLQSDVFEKLGTLALLATKYDLAIERYRTSIEIGISSRLADSLLFDPTLYLGESYYLTGKADSSIFFLKEAEKRLHGPTASNQSSRLFNSLGVIYYESGNYSQAVNYFNKAKNLTIGQRDFDELEPYYKYALFSFLNNIGSCLVNLDQPDSALSIYKKLLGSNIEPDKTRLQIARIFLVLQQVDSAERYIGQVGDQAGISPFFADLRAEALIQKGNRLAAEDLLVDFLEIRKEADFRLSPLNNKLGALAFDRGDFLGAAAHYHRAIIQADGNFDQKDIFKNPSDYSVGFASNHLFQALIGKATAFERLSAGENRNDYFEHSVASFQAAFDFAYLVANYYDNDEARVFFSDFVLDGYRRGISLVLGKYFETGEEGLLERAFMWSEESKAMGLNIGIREKRVKTLADVPDELIQKERDIQFSLSQIQQKIFAESDEQRRRILNELALDKRLELSRLHSQFSEFTGYENAKNEKNSIDLEELKGSLGRSNTLLLSFFDAGDAWYAFHLDGQSLDVYEISDHAALDRAIPEFKTRISTFELGKEYKTGGIGTELFRLLLSPILPKLSEYDNLVIIPHSSLAGLPFEVLEMPDGGFLVEAQRMSYQLSSTFFSSEKKKYLNSTIVGFAPFHSSGLETGGEKLDRLPYSLEELESFEGEKFLDSAATKERFFDKIDAANILHLATHAVAKSTQSQAAFVAFFPDESSDKLYPIEISGLSLENTSLVFLSACETNYGSLSAGEGIIGLSRSFAFAGCKNLITTLWKAEDKATAYISARFYAHLDEGDGYALALQKAKNDLLSDPSMAQFHHPAFWAHLVLIGDLPSSGKLNLIYYLLLGMVLLAGGLFWWTKSKK
jgi:CHAT domain-containing protein